MKVTEFDRVQLELRYLGLSIEFVTDHYLVKFNDDLSVSYGYVADTLEEALTVGQALKEWRDKVSGKIHQGYYADMQRVNRNEPLSAGRRDNGDQIIVKLHHPFFERQPMYEKLDNVVTLPIVRVAEYTNE